jgi:hypothetical protein
MSDNLLTGCETETIDKLFLELSQFTGARTRDELKYDELIYAVQRKFPNESRFETALRYIREMESKIAAENQTPKTVGSKQISG